jgi:hypothetical protein
MLNVRRMFVPASALVAAQVLLSLAMPGGVAGGVPGT